MLGARPKKMMNMYIYDILRRNTDAEHPMTQREIQKRLESDYDMTVDRKAVKANLEDLINDGSYNIEYATKIRLTPNRLTGEIEKNEVLTGFYYDNIFTDSELRLLMDSVLFSRSIPTNNKKEMLGKLKDLSNKFFKFSTANIQSYESVDREMNRELFYTIEVLDEAISKGLQVKFFYNEYGTDKKLHHRKNEDGDVREYIINPYTMVANGGKYYLICNYDKYDNLSHYRIDRISNIEILETPRKPKNQVEGLVGLDVAKYMQEHIFMFGGKSIRAKFEMLKENINEIIELLSLDLPSVAEIISDEYKSSKIEQCYDDLYNLFFLIMYDGSQLMELAIKQNECEDRYDLPRLETIPTFNANVEIDYSDCKTNYCYIVNSVTEYINILFYAFVSNNPIVSVCNNCDRLFVPKTKKLTLYCDRITNEHTTCKQIGAKNKYNDKVEEDPVLKAYQLEKHRIEMYCLSSKQDKYDFFDDYFDWLRMFEPKIAEYKNGNYDGNKLIKEIKSQTPNFQPYSKGKDFANEEGY